MDKKKIERINELGRIAATRQLTVAELAERQQLRQEYLQYFRAAIRGEKTGGQNQK